MFPEISPCCLQNDGLTCLYYVILFYNYMATFPQEAFEALWFYSLYIVMRLALPHAFSHFSVAYI